MGKRDRNNGVGFTGLLTLLFIAFKLLGVITWTWFWVLSPVWIMVILFILFVAILSIIS